MPIYEYLCPKCNHRFEQLQQLGEAELTLCPHCGAAGLRKLVSAAGFQLKGTGWYVTDFKGGNKGNADAAATKDDAAASTQAQAKAATSDASGAKCSGCVHREKCAEKGGIAGEAN